MQLLACMTGEDKSCDRRANRKDHQQHICRRRALPCSIERQATHMQRVWSGKASLMQMVRRQLVEIMGRSPEEELHMRYMGCLDSQTTSHTTERLPASTYLGTIVCGAWGCLGARSDTEDRGRPQFR